MKAPLVVTGSQGFLGHHVREAISARGREVIGVDREGTGAEIELDLADPALDATSLARRCGRVDGAIYLAANITRGSSVDADARENLSTIAFAAAKTFRAFHRANRGCHFVYCSSYKVYGPSAMPIDPAGASFCPDPHSYGAAKVLGERLLRLEAREREAGLAVVRPTCIYGPGQHRRDAIPKFLSGLLKGHSPVVYGRGDSLRDDVFVADVAYCLVEACLRRATGSFNAAGERSRTVLEIAQACSNAVAEARRTKALRPMVDENLRPKWWLDQRFDTTRSAAELGLRPMPLRDGLLCEVRWLQADASHADAPRFAPPPRVATS